MCIRDSYSIEQDNVGFNAELSELEGSRNLTPAADEEIPQQEPEPPEPTAQDRAAATTQAARITLRGTDTPSDRGPGDNRSFAGETLFRNTNTPADLR